MPKDTKEEYIEEKLKEWEEKLIWLDESASYKESLKEEVRVSLSEAWDRGKGVDKTLE